MNRTIARLSLAAATAATIAVAATPATARTLAGRAAGDQPAALKGGSAHSPAAATLPRYVMWDLASDFGITASNPQPDSYGDASVWSFLQGSNLRNPSTFTRLGTYTNAQFGVPGLRSWQGPLLSQPDDFLPQVGINASGAVADGSTTPEMAGIYWPKNVILVHPSTSDAIIGWTSPVTMTVTVAATVTKLDRACGSGMSWRLADGSQQLASGSLTSTSSPQGTVRRLPVSAGTHIYLEVGPGPDHDFTCDSTGVALTITGQRF